MNDLFRTEMFLAAPPEHVFEFFVDADLMVSWIGISARLDPRPSGAFRFEVAPGEWCSGSYLEVDPPRRVVFTWGWESGAIPLPPGSSTVEVDLQPDFGGTRLVLVHRGLEGDVLRLHEEGWCRFLGRLEAVIAGGEPEPDPGTETPQQALDRMERP
jgi:uncharacterized protein YndB with AHSA1/START domain